MIEIINILLIAVALSMDTFSLSLGLGTYNLNKKKIYQISITVGLMHFLMPQTLYPCLPFPACDRNLELPDTIHWDYP